MSKRSHQWYDVATMAYMRDVSVSCVGVQLYTIRHTKPELYSTLTKKIGKYVYIRDDFYDIAFNEFEKREIERIYYKYVYDFSDDMALTRDIIAVTQTTMHKLNLYSKLHNKKWRQSYMALYAVLAEYERRKDAKTIC